MSQVCHFDYGKSIWKIESKSSTTAEDSKLELLLFSGICGPFDILSFEIPSSTDLYGAFVTFVSIKPDYSLSIIYNLFLRH